VNRRSRLILLAGAVVVAVSGVGCRSDGCPVVWPPARLIKLERNVSIATRLRPGDKEVVVCRVQESPPYGPLSRTEYSFAQEVDIRKPGDFTVLIAVVRVMSAKGELSQDGAWVRTRVRAQVDRVVGSRLGGVLDPALEFFLGSGTTQMGAVTVTAGNFLLFAPGERYLVFLYRNGRCWSLLSTVAAIFNNRASLVEGYRT
jgi:hypothetical protein